MSDGAGRKFASSVAHVEIGADISLSSLKEGEWKERLERAIHFRVAEAISNTSMREAEEAKEQLTGELEELHEHLQEAAEITLLLERDAIVMSDEHFINQANCSESLTQEEIDIALQAHRRATFCMSHEGRPWPLLETTAEQLKIYGTGIHLYFSFNAIFLQRFLVAACLSIPLMVFNGLGDGLSRHEGETSRAVRTTAGNVGMDGFSSGSFRVHDLTKYCGALDAIIALIVYLSAVYFELVVIPKVAGHEAKNRATPTTFSVFLDNLPEEIFTSDDHRTSGEVLKAHFETLLRGEVTLARAFPGLRVLQAPKDGSQICDRLAKICRKGRIKRVMPESKSCSVRWEGQKETEVVDLTRADGSAELLDAPLLRRMEQSGCAGFAHSRGGAGNCVHQVVLVRDHGGRHWLEEGKRGDSAELEELPVLGAFVVFSHTAHRDFLHDREYRFSRSSLGRLCQARRLRLQGKAMRMSEAPAPSDVFWVNMDFPNSERVLRTGLIVLFCMMLLAVSVILFAVGKNASANAKSQQQTLSCSRPNATLLSNNISTTCLCSTAGYSNVLADNPPGIHAQCFDWLKQVALVTSLSVGAAAISSTVNFIIGYIVEFFAHFTKPRSVTTLELNILQMTFIFKLLTLGVTAVLVNADFDISLLGFDGILGLIGNGNHRDISTKWFAEVGWQVILMNTFGIVNPFLFLVWALCYQLYWWHSQGKLKTWEELKAIYTPPPFPFALQHAEVLSAMFVTLVFSSGMPILMIILLVRLGLYAAVDRYVLLRCSGRPPRYTHHLALAMSQWLQIAVWAHSAFALWTFGNPAVYPSEPFFGGTQNSTVILRMTQASSAFGQVTSRGMQASALPNTCVLLGITLTALVRLLVFLFGQGTFKVIASATFDAAWRCLAAPRRRRQLSMREDAAFYHGPLKAMQRKRIVHSYDPFDLPQYKAKEVKSEELDRFKAAARACMLMGQSKDQAQTQREGQQGLALQDVLVGMGREDANPRTRSRSKGSRTTTTISHEEELVGETPRESIVVRGSPPSRKSRPIETE